jgi:hypothetical protein
LNLCKEGNKRAGIFHIDFHPYFGGHTYEIGWVVLVFFPDIIEKHNPPDDGRRASK